jgi:hypothetical protein
MAAKTDIAEYREAALEVVHADSNEDMQADIKINHGKKKCYVYGKPRYWLIKHISDK